MNALYIAITIVLKCNYGLCAWVSTTLAGAPSLTSGKGSYRGLVGPREGRYVNLRCWFRGGTSWHEGQVGA